MKSHLLPEGFRDSLPDLAKKELIITSIFIDLMNKNGYEYIKPPLLEFEKSLFSLTKNQKNTNSFRVLDPISQKMMGLRSDITSQIARISCSSFEKKKRPLRLSYSGEILKVKNNQLNISRQLTQVGAEIIGITNNNYEVEIINIIIMILEVLKIDHYSISFSMPSLFEAICKDFSLDEKQSLYLKEKYENKNLLGISDLSEELFNVSSILIKSVGTFNDNFKAINIFKFPKFVQIEIDKFIKSLLTISKKIKKIEFNIDPIEIDKFGYHNGILFKFYSNNFHELFSGGRYNVNDENCIGFSSIVEKLIKEFSFIEKKIKRILIPSNENNVDRLKLVNDEFLIINYNEEINVDDIKNEAKKNKCDYFMLNNEILKI